MTENESPSVLRLTYYYLRLGRPLFLLGGILLHGLGVVMALYSGVKLDIATLLWTQIAITAIQLMTHYSNDYYDLAADEANTSPTRWSGGSQILAKGLLPPQVALITAMTMAVVALFAALWLVVVLETGPLTMPLILLAGILGWSYSSPPLQLNMHGLGEITGAALITGLTPIVGYYMQAGGLNLLPFLAVFPLACLQFAMLMVVNFPDAEGDMASGKHTLLYFVGSQRAVRLYLGALALAYLSLPLLVWLGLPIQVALALLLIAPMAIGQGWRMWRGAWADPARWDSLGFWSIGLVMSSAGVEFVAFLLLYLR
ncbi:MAG: prenyltransferase [Chloroflexota bacterium]|nr:MAG: prenyltransferase [Chloroflexota bacterium]